MSVLLMLQVYWIAKQCSEKCTPEEFAVALAKHLVTKYEKVGQVTAMARCAMTLSVDALKQ